jgi:hypothetical protein
MIMKRIYRVLILLFVAALLSCADDNLDPLKTKQVKKGTVLALRGTQLDNIYNKLIPGAEFYPGVITGDETFDFDAEYLAEDPTTLESFDIYVLKQTAGGTERVHMLNVPFSQFKTTSDYMRPWVSVSIKLTDILAAVGIDDYDDPDAIEALLSDYQPGINLESDLHLTDGSTVSSAEIVAVGLFNSDQFYPAQKLTYNSILFCPFEHDAWDGVDFEAVEIYSNGTVSEFYNVTVQWDGGDNYSIHNFGDNGAVVNLNFNPATHSQYDQTIVVPDQSIKGKPSKGKGTYVQCDMDFSITVVDDKKVSTVYQFKML